MDDLTAALAGSFQVSHHPNNPAAPHPKFQDLYKLKGSVLDQHERRKRAITYQKKGRFDQLSHVRRLADNIWDGDYVGDYGEDHEEAMETAPPARRKPGRNYRMQLMLSEWMLEVPENFSGEFVMIPCPVGKRNLVIAAKGMTYAYAKSGYLMMEFPSWLPGGNVQQGYNKTQADATIMDCVYVENMKTFFILDLMCWKSHPIYDTETEFRLFWLNSQLSELPKVAQTSKANPYKFVALPNFACDKENLQGIMMTPMTTQLDGLLFYHKLTHYTFGPTPLVLWLKAYMMPEILGVQVAVYHMAQKPGSYKGFANHVEQVKIDNQKESGKSKRRPGSYGGIETPTCTPGNLEPGSYPRDLQPEGRYYRSDSHRRSRTISGGASQQHHLHTPPGHIPHSAKRSPGDDQPQKKSVLQAGRFQAPVSTQDGFTFASSDVRVRDAKANSETTTASMESTLTGPEQTIQIGEKMEVEKSASKKKNKKNKKGRKIAAKMDM